MTGETAYQPTVMGASRIGMVLEDRYEILRQIGEGGFGVVYEGKNLRINRKVAIKCLHPEFARSPQVVARFHREAEAATSIGHPNIVEVFDMGQLPDGTAYMVMEHLDGREWWQDLEGGDPQPLDRVAHVVLQVCEALTAAHEKGVIHRDLKPENVFLVVRGSSQNFAKVLDFGIAKVRAKDDGSLNLTQTGMAMGTPYYMAPEQSQNLKDVDHRADIYALGVMLYRALTGEFPLDATSYMELIAKKHVDPPPPLGRLRPDLPEELDRLVLSMLSKDPGGRPTSCAVVAEAIARLARHEPTRPLPGTVIAPATPVPRTVAAPATPVPVAVQQHATPAPIIVQKVTPIPVAVQQLASPAPIVVQQPASSTSEAAVPAAGIDSIVPARRSRLPLVILIIAFLVLTLGAVLIGAPWIGARSARPLPGGEAEIRSAGVTKPFDGDGGADANEPHVEPDAGSTGGDASADVAPVRDAPPVVAPRIPRRPPPTSGPRPLVTEEAPVVVAPREPPPAPPRQEPPPPNPQEKQPPTSLPSLMGIP